MVLMVAIGAAAYTYANKNNDEDAGDGESSNLPPAEPLEPDFLAALKPIDLLPLERTLTLFEAPNATITFMDGSPQVASDWLRSRVSEVVYRNPWLGGYLGKDKSRGGAVSLFYDPSSDEVNTDVFASFDPGAIELTRETKYEDFGGTFSGHDVVVRCNADLVGRNQPIFRVCVIPDAKEPDDKFALVVSMSHVAGDGFTFHKIFKFLSTDCDASDIEEMNPIRKHEFTEAVYDLCGSGEAFYVDRISRSPIWSKFTKRDETVIVRAAFYIEEEWVEGQKEAWEKMARMEEAEKLLIGNASAKDMESNLAPVGEDEVVADDCGPRSTSTPEQDKSAPTTSKQPLPANFKVSFAAHQTASHITTNDIITSWFFRTCDATIGLMPFMLRERMPQFTSNDAGNYAITIPFPRKDYHSPMLIRDARPTGRRVHTDIPLPPHRAENRYGISIDWRGVGFKRGGLQLGPKGECKQALHLPCYQSQDYKYIPKNFSSVHLFNAGPNGEPAVSIVCPDYVMDRVLQSGIVKGMINEGQISNREQDTFAEAVVEAKEGRRTSVFASLLDPEAAKDLNAASVLSIIADEDDD